MSGLVALVVASSVLGQAPAGAAEMTEFAEVMAGKWVGESTVDFDIPGICKKGDKLTIHISRERVMGGSALLTSAKYDVNGKTVGEGVGLSGWDAARKGIHTSSFGSLGGRSQGIWKKQRGKWRQRGQGNIAGTVKTSGVTTLTIVDEDTHTTQETQRKMGDEDLPDIEITFNRVK